MDMTNLMNSNLNETLNPPLDSDIGITGNAVKFITPKEYSHDKISYHSS